MPRTLAQNAQYIAETIKPAIKSAIEAQGVTVPSTDSFLDYADRIAEIEGGGSGYQLKDLPSGTISTVTDAEALPLNALKVSVEAWQEGSGDPSPSNVRPIHGWDSGEITVCDDVQSPTQTETITQQFPTTIYGAEWDVVGGGMTEGYIKQALTSYIGAIEMTSTQTSGVYRARIVPNPPVEVATTLVDVLVESDTLRGVDARGTYTNGMRVEYSISGDTSGNYIDMFATDLQTVSDWENFITANDIHIKYKLATPQTIQLSPLSIRMNGGTNNVYADCGEVIEGEYFSGSAKGYVDGIKYAGEGDGGIASYTNVKSADELLGATAITFEVYARIDSYVSKTSGAYARLMEFGNSQQTGRLGFVGLASDNDNNLCYWDDTADVASGIDTWTLGDTHLVSIVKTTAGALKIYVDGVLKYTGASTLTITSSIIDYVALRGIYAQPSNTGRQLNGEVYTWRVYAKELSAANIAQNLTADRSLYSR